MKYDYYYNNVPGDGLCRNNLIYTSLISSDKKTFVQWYHNDTEYHHGKNQVVDPALMKDKWSRELCFLTHMSKNYPDLVPEIIDIDLREQKIYLAIDGVDFWQRKLDNNGSFDDVLPDWQEQLLHIYQAHKELDMWKYSLHPSSYFIVNGRLKSINYFFCYDNNENNFSLKDVESHIYSTRQTILKKIMFEKGYAWDEKIPFQVIQNLALESFRKDFTDEFTDKAIQVLNV